MQVEIWSDIMCPFCYIGKRRFEKAMATFEGSADIEIIWKSYQLDPNQEDVPGKSINQYLAERKGWTVDYAREMNKYVTDMAAGEGLVYDMDRAVVANSFNAHRIIQLDIEAMLDSGLYVNEVQADAHEAAALGARGVPFFVFNRKYAVSGAQPVEAFSQVLDTAFSDWKLTKENSPAIINDGDMCDTDGNC